MSAPTPLNEEQRLNALYEYGLLDTDAEQDYDELVKLASQICCCPIALMVLLDKDRQWFKARVGLAARETPRDQAFCAHAILEPTKIMVVPDATRDDRFAANPLVTGDPKIRFYAGAPMTTTDGLALGTLCVIDREARGLSVEQSSALATLARQASRLIELRRVSSALADALSEVKVLEGLLPICAYCKNIRDEKGEWHRIERYVIDRTAAKFTHGICPDCAKERYPDLDLTGGGNGY